MERPIRPWQRPPRLVPSLQHVRESPKKAPRNTGEIAHSGELQLKFLKLFFDKVFVIV